RTSSCRRGTWGGPRPRPPWSRAGQGRRPARGPGPGRTCCSSLRIPPSPDSPGVFFLCGESALDTACPNCTIVAIQWDSGGPRAKGMQIHTSPADGVPISLQIVQQVKSLVASGRLTAGEELPPIRVLAEQLLINPNTVARAYRELELAGVVEKRRTAG